jgi:hypothetical protein
MYLSVSRLLVVLLSCRLFDCNVLYVTCGSDMSEELGD